MSYLALSLKLIESTDKVIRKSVADCFSRSHAFAFHRLKMSVTVAIEKAAETVGEGPHWDPVSKSLFYVDILAGDVHKWDSKTGEDTKVHFGTQ